MRKERFPSKRKSKLQPRGDGPFQVIAKVNDNAYKLDLPGEFNVSATFNVSDLSPYVGELDSRTNPLEEEGNDGDTPKLFYKDKKMDPLIIQSGPITRARAKKIKESMLLLVAEIKAQFQDHSTLGQMVNMIQVGGQPKA